MGKFLTIGASMLLAGCATRTVDSALMSLSVDPVPAQETTTVAEPSREQSATSTGESANVMTGQANGEAKHAPWEQRLIDPVTAPFLFETPVIHSTVQPVFLRHEFPGTSILGGGNLRGYAVQLRYALNDDLAFIAIKDGRIDYNPGGASDATGWGDLSGGLKYKVYEDLDAGEIVSVGFTYEATQGSRQVLQGNGEGGWHPFVSAGWDDGENNAIASIGAYLPVDGDAESQYINYHLHYSWEIDEVFVPLVEINGLHYTNNGRALPVNQEGVDYANIGANNVEGNDIITGAVGFRWRFSENIDFGLAYEDTLTAREDVFGNRVTADMIWRY